MHALNRAAKREDIQTVRDLLASGADVNEADPNGETPVMIAAYRGNTAIVRLLLDAGADINAGAPTAHWSPLARAADAQSRGAVVLLLKRGANAGAPFYEHTVADLVREHWPNDDEINNLIDSSKHDAS